MRKSEAEIIQAELTKASGLFDRDWYLSEYPDVKVLDMDPVEHYLRIGARLLRNPSPNFDASFYLRSNPDVEKAGINPLFHFILWGRAEGRKPTSSPVSSRWLTAGGQENRVPVRDLRTSSQSSGFEAAANVAIVVNAGGPQEWLAALGMMATTTCDYDLFLQGPDDKLSMRDIPKACRTVNWVKYEADPEGSAQSFMHVLRSGVLDQYRAICWMSSAEGDKGPPPEHAANFLLENEDCGLIAGALAPLSAIMTPALERALKILLPRLGRPFPNLSIAVPRGRMIWLRPLLLRHIAAMAIDPNLLGAASGSVRAENSFPGRDTVLSLLGIMAAEGQLNVLNFGEAARPFLPTVIKKSRNRSVKAVAFYLPQFHPIPENDRWWGKGFTEWTNVIRGKPLFRHHYQPRLPSDLGFYDLRLQEVQEAQAALARKFGVYGFCYYYYWFNGRKLLNRPIEQMLGSGKPDLPFCVCWANENWSRNWDGQSHHILLEQKYSTDSNRAFIREIIPIMKDPRYIRYLGKPVLIIYRVTIIPDWMQTTQMWREECRRAGVGEIHLCAVRFGLEPLKGPPTAHGVDAYVLFPPHEAARGDLRSEVLDLSRHFSGEILSYDAVIEGDVKRFAKGYPWSVHRGAMLAWDNTARRQGSARIFHGATPLRFRSWISSILTQEAEYNPDGESLVFLNAWNEWAEGATLEPDQRWGTGYLDAFRSAASRHILKAEQVTKAERNTHAPPTGSGVPAQVSRAEKPSANIGEKLQSPKWHAGEVVHNPAFPTILLCAHISGHQLFGGERSFLDVLEALRSMPVNVVVTLPSDNNREYIALICKRCVGLYAFPYRQWMDNRKIDEALVLLFADIIVRHDVAMVHANTIVLLEPLIAAKRMNRLALVHARELISLDEPLRERMGLSSQDIIHQVFRRTDYIIGNSRATCQVFSRQGRIFYVPNAVSLDAFDMPNRISGKIRFGIVSSNTPKKGIADFVEVAKLCQGRTDEAEFIIIGTENELIEQLKREVKAGALPPSLKFVGYRDTPPKAMAELNVLLNLSSFAESFGRTVTEALAARRPVIVYEWGALPELVQHGETGFLAAYRDVNAVAEAVLNMAQNPAAVLRMGERGRASIAQRFSQATLREHLAKAYSAILGREMKCRPAASPIPAKKSLTTPPPMTTVVIPVYNAPDEVHTCLESVIRHTDFIRARVLVINDGSPDRRVSELLRRYDHVGGIRILHNDSNLGYTRTINLGIREAKDDDVVLLNSDTRVTANWIEGLRAAAYLQTRVGTVTAMSDNAGSFSFPIEGEKNTKPDGLGLDDYARLMLEATGSCAPVEVPTGSGFCMFIRRTLIQEIGLFDEQAFPRGYGEENDYCMRALKADWKSVISPWTFVYHTRSASFGEEKTILVKAGVNVVTRRHPEYATLVKQAFSGSTMAALRKAAAGALAKCAPEL